MMGNCFSFRILLENGDFGDGARGNSGCYFKIVQSNEFKHLCHISLRVGLGSHEDVRKHLDLKLKSIQENFSRLSTEHETLKHRNSENLSILTETEAKLKALEVSVYSIIRYIYIKYLGEIISNDYYS